MFATNLFSMKYCNSGMIAKRLLVFICLLISCVGFVQRAMPKMSFKRRLHAVAVDPIDPIWDSLRKDALSEADREPIMASLMHSSILSHGSLEQSVSYHMANLLSSPSMSSTQIQSLFLNVFEKSPTFREYIRRDIEAVKQRDPAVKSYTDVLLYFKGFHAIQAHRVAHWLWNNDKATLALFLYSRSNLVFNIDIHPGARLGSALLLDHGTGVVIGETAVVGHNVSMLHKVTLGGTGLDPGQRHPIIGDCVLLGAGATVLGPVTIGEGAHIGAASMVLEDVPPHSVAVGVPAKVISRRVNPALETSPALTMDQTNSMLFYDI